MVPVDQEEGGGEGGGGGLLGRSYKQTRQKKPFIIDFFEAVCGLPLRWGGAGVSEANATFILCMFARSNCLFKRENI